MGLEVTDHFLHLGGVFHDLLLALLCLHTDLEDFIDHLLQVLNQVVVLLFVVLICLVDHAHKDFTVVLQSPPQSLQVVVHLHTTNQISSAFHLPIQRTNRLCHLEQ